MASAEEAAALAAAEGLQDETPKKTTPKTAASPKAAKTSTPMKKPGSKKVIKTPKAKAAKAKGQPKKRPAAAKSEESETKKEPAEEEVKPVDKKNKKRKDDEEKALKLTLEEGVTQSPPEASGSKEGKVLRDQGKAYYFHRNFTRLPEEARFFFRVVYVSLHVHVHDEFQMTVLHVSLEGTASLQLKDFVQGPENTAG